MAIILIASVISRTLFNKSLTFGEELGQALVIVVTFLGVGYGARKARHISMSAIFDLLNEKYKKIFIYAISSGTSITMFYLAYLGARYTQSVYALGRVTPALRIPMYLIVVVVPIGFLMGAIEYAKTFIINIREKEVYLSSEKILGRETFDGDFLEVSETNNGATDIKSEEV